MRWDPTPRGVLASLDRAGFRREFEDYGRQDNFSPAALDALYDYFEDYADCIDAPFMVDVIGICCDWGEYTLKEALEEFDVEDMEELDDYTILVVPHYGQDDTYLIAT